MHFLFLYLSFSYGSELRLMRNSLLALLSNFHLFIITMWESGAVWAKLFKNWIINCGIVKTQYSVLVPIHFITKKNCAPLRCSKWANGIMNMNHEHWTCIPIYIYIYIDIVGIFILFYFQFEWFDAHSLSSRQTVYSNKVSYLSMIINSILCLFFSSLRSLMFICLMFIRCY